jgi:hypothetical protein
VAEEDEAVLVRLLQQHHAHGRRARRRGGRERHRLRHPHDLARLREPALERAQRVGVEILSPQRPVSHEINDCRNAMATA